MIPDKSLTLSIVIPAYNEEEVIASCLHAISQQTIMPDEVIVVDNNSNDRTAAIAALFPFVKVITEPTQGIIPAHHAGFRLAKSDIIARIDSDTVMSKNWVERAKRTFAQRPEVDAVTGPGGVYELATNEGSYPGQIFSKYYFALGRQLFGFQLLWCSNMAIRKTMWDKIDLMTCYNERIVHDDVDISVLIHHVGGNILYDRYLKVYIHGFRFVGPKKVAHYHRKIVKTRTYHIKRGTFVPIPRKK